MFSFAEDFEEPASCSCFSTRRRSAIVILRSASAAAPAFLARTRFFGEGHKLSGLDPKRLGVVPFYRGAGRVRTPEAKPAVVRAKNTGAAAEAERRMTIAERRLAEKQEQLAGSSKSSAKENK